MKTILGYVTGFIAILVVATSVISAVLYASTHGSETVQNLATSTLSGIGISLGGLIGSALVMRFQASRNFLKKMLGDLK